jgi:MFS transporter, ACS family, DAL5 transporter family protein
MIPGCTYLITCWYTRFEVGKRLSGFWILSVIFSGFSGIFAYVLALLEGKGGLNGWSCESLPSSTLKTYP